jgi:cation diffusion facilitator CzcD-associated flavoprotein CzcO
MNTDDQPKPAQPGAPEHVDVIVIGAGPVGLDLDWRPSQQRVASFLIVDAGPEVGQVWRSRLARRPYLARAYDRSKRAPANASALTTGLAGRAHRGR